MKRRVLPYFLVAVFAAAAVWLGCSESGLRALAGLAEPLTGGRLQIEPARGRLLGRFELDRLRWQGADLQVEAGAIAVDWSPARLLAGALQIEALSIGRLQLVSRPDAAPTPLPVEFRLPLAVDLRRLAISRLVYGDAGEVGELSARFSSDGRRHRIDDLRARLAGVEIRARAGLDGAAPLPLEASAELVGRLEQRPLALHLTANGPLERIALTGQATQGFDGQFSALLTPFATAPFASARLQLENLDPAAWLAGAPQARISVNADLAPQGRGIVGSFGLSNPLPGPLDRQRLPLVTLAGGIDWQGASVRFSSLHAALPGGGELAGRGEWSAGQLQLALTARRLDAAQIATLLRSTRLDGPISATLGAERQALNCELKDATYRLRIEASQAAGRLDLAQLQLAAGEARLSARGRLALDASRDFSLAGELQNFDPARFASLPAARINANFKAAGRLAPPTRFEGSFVLHDSRLSGQLLGGQGQFSVDWPRILGADIELRAGTNRLTAQGAFGRPGDRLLVDITAPDLAPYGLSGDLSAHFDLSGSAQQPGIAGRMQSLRLGRPTLGELRGLSLKLGAGAEPASPLSLDLAIDRFDAVDQPGVLQAVRIQGEGSNRAHRLSASLLLADRQRLTLSAEGGLGESGWQGQVLEARLLASEAARNVRLLGPAPLRLAGAGWAVGPLRLAGDPLDWQATFQATAEAGKLRAGLSASGGRLGRIDGELTAGLRGAWSLDRQAPWRGRLTAAMSDLGWLGEIIGEGWQSEGQLAGELALAGSPERPVGSGRLQGEKLGLGLPAQGLRLTRGELAVELRDNLLLIRRLGFDSLLQALPRALRLAAGEELAALTRQPGRLEITGQIALDRAAQQVPLGDAAKPTVPRAQVPLAGALKKVPLGDAARQFPSGGKPNQDPPDAAWLDVQLDRVGVFQLPEQWVAVSGKGRLNWRDGTLGARGKLAVDAGYWQLAPVGAPRLSEDVTILRPGRQASAAPLRPRFELDLDADLGRNFLFHGAGLSSRLVGEVNIAAHGRDLPRASGTIRTRGGRFEAYGQKLEIERGSLAFNGLLDNPGLDVRAVRKGLAVEPGVHLGGTAQKPVVRLVSDPDLADPEKLAWLVLGHGSEQAGGGDAGLLLAAAGGLLGNESGNLVRQLQGLFGIDEFGVRQGQLGDLGRRQAGSRIAGGGTMAGNTGQQILSVGKRLSANALLSYEQTLGKAESIVKLTVNLGRRIALIGRAGSDNALDIFYTLTFGRRDDPPADDK